MKVRAIRDGFYGNSRRRLGDEFVLREGDKLGKWMERVEPAKPQGKKAQKPVEPEQGSVSDSEVI